MSGMIALPQRHLINPQYSVELDTRYRDAIFFSLFNDGSGKDIGPSGNHLLPGVSPTKVVTKSGRTLSFNGSTQYLQTAKSFAPTQYTVMCWATQRVLNTGYNRIIDQSHIDGFTLLCLAGSGAWTWVASGSGLASCVGNTPAAGQRVFLVGTYDGVTARLYEDGVQTASTPWSTPSMTSQPITVGTNLSFAQYFDGTIENPGVFPRAFSAAEIRDIYNNPGKLFKSRTSRLFISTGGGSSSFTITPSGGVVFSGTVTPAKGRSFSVGGNVSLSGHGVVVGTRTYTITPTGSVVFTGTAPITHSTSNTYTLTPVGGVALGGHSGLTSGSATSNTLNVSGGVALTGTVKFIKTNIQIPTGGIVFSGSAPLSSNTVVTLYNTRMTLTGAGK